MSSNSTNHDTSSLTSNPKKTGALEEVIWDKKQYPYFPRSLPSKEERERRAKENEEAVAIEPDQPPLETVKVTK
jgi:hypothetical protein